MTAGTDTGSEGAQPSRSPISQGELIALLAMLSATVAFSIDSMLPALPEMGAALSPADPNRVQLVLASFIIGLGVGTLFTGPLSDALGRRPVAVGGAVVYTLAALYAARSHDLDEMLVARAIQGLGAAGPRVVALALIRDLFSGRQMARIASFVMIVFTLVPIIAPSLGAVIQWAFGWRAIFVSFAVFSFISMIWLMLRQPETLPPERRRPFRFGTIARGIAEVFGTRQAMLAICVQTLVFSILFSALLSSQPIFDIVYGRNETFPLWFGVVAAVSSTASILNAMVVVRLGMRMVVKWALLIQLLASCAFLALQLSLGASAPPFGLALIYLITVFYVAGLGIGNLNAIALEPLGHMAGMAASIIGATATIVSMILAAPIGQAFDGTMIPLTIGVLVLTGTAFLLTLQIRETEDEPSPPDASGA